MPFQSEKQRRFLWAAHPDIAKRWAHEYPESNKNLPLYAGDTDSKAPKAEKKSPAKPAKEKAAQYNVSDVISKIAASWTTSSCSILGVQTEENVKKSDSKQEKIEIPHSEKPVYAGEEREKGLVADSGVNGMNSDESQGQNAINTLLQKISAVLAPHIEQTIENMNAENEGRVPRRIGRNRGLKNYPQPTPQIPLPLGMQMSQTPNQPQPQQSHVTAPQHPGHPSTVGAGQSSATTDPIKFHSGLSASGIINGNAGLSAPNTVNTKISGAGDAIQQILMSMEHIDHDDMGYILAEERIKSAVEKWSQDFDPTLSRDAENAVMHGTGLVGSLALGTVAGLPFSAGIEHLIQQNNLMPNDEKNPWKYGLMQTLIRTPMIAGGMLGTRLYDNYILRPHMRRELQRKQEEEAVRQRLEMQAMKKHAEASLGRILGTALASTAGGLALGGYPGWKLQRASEAAGHNDFVNFIAGKAPIALAGALSAAGYNHLYDQYEKKQPKKKQPSPEHESLKYLQYLVH